MEHTEPPEPSGEGAGAEPDEPADVLRRLEQRLERASDAAERLLAEAARASAASAARLADSAARAARPGAGDPAPAGGNPSPAGGNRPDGGATPPAAGWQVRSEDTRADVEVLSQVIQSLRDLIPPELQRRLADALRELLLAVRALIDWYLERIDQRRPEPADVQDIPIL